MAGNSVEQLISAFHIYLVVIHLSSLAVSLVIIGSSIIGGSTKLPQPVQMSLLLQLTDHRTETKVLKKWFWIHVAWGQ